MRISLLFPFLLVVSTINAETVELEEVVVTATKRGDANVWELAIFGDNPGDEEVGIISFSLPLQAGSRGLFPTTPRAAPLQLLI